MDDPSIPSIEDALRAFQNRAARLPRLVELGAPTVIVSNEIELVLQALEWIEARRGDRDGAARMRLVSKLRLEAEIAKAGGQEAWERKIEAELLVEDALMEAEDAPKH